MDAVELPLPATVDASKLMGSEGFGVVGVTSEEVEAREPDRFSTLASLSIDPCTSRLGQRDEAVNASGPTFWNKISNVEDSSKELNTERISNPLLPVPVPEAKQSVKKSVKMARSNSGSSKRSRLAQCEVSVNEIGAGDINGKLKELGSFDAKSNIAEKTQSIKQKNNSNGKRGDKRNGKVPKSKCDSFCLKAGLVSFSSAAGGNNILGLYGLKADVNDVTKQLDEPLLNELLDGSYKCPSITKEKGKQPSNSNENIMCSFREACSILRLQKPVQPNDFAGTDNSSVEVNRNDSEKADTQLADLFSHNKVQDLKTTASNIINYKLHQPKDVLERLSLPTPKDLDILLIDPKPASASKSNLDPRLGKPVSQRSGLQPFSWSQSSAGNCRSNSDSVKLSASRHTCLGRWVKVGNPSSFVEPATGFLAEFESLTYDHRLVPLRTLKCGPKYENGQPPVIYPHSSATCSISSPFPPAEQCTKLLAAAQILLDIATHSMKQNPHEMRRWPKKPSQKSMRACNYKPNEKPEYVFAVPKPKPKPDGLLNGAYGTTIPSKKLKLSGNEKHIQTDDNLLRGPINWSTKTRHHNNNNNIKATALKKSCMMLPPPPRVLDKPSSNQPKVRKFGAMDWSKMD